MYTLYYYFLTKSVRSQSFMVHTHSSHSSIWKALLSNTFYTFANIDLSQVALYFKFLNSKMHYLLISQSIVLNRNFLKTSSSACFDSGLSVSISLSSKAIELKVNRDAIEKNSITQPSSFWYQCLTNKIPLNNIEHAQDVDKKSNFMNFCTFDTMICRKISV